MNFGVWSKRQLISEIRSIDNEMASFKNSSGYLETDYAGHVRTIGALCNSAGRRVFSSFHYS